MDHRQLEMRVRVVDRLAAGLGDDDDREGGRGQRRAPGLRPDRCPPSPRPSPPGPSCPRSAPGPSPQIRADLDEDRDRQIAARAHQREAAALHPTRPPRGQTGLARAARRARARRGRRRGPGPRSADGDEQDRGQRGAAATPEQAGRRRSRSSTSTMLFPQARRSSRNGWSKGWAAAPLEPRLPVLDEARQERREHDPAEELRGAEAQAHPVHPDHPSRAAASRTRRARDQVRTYVPSRRSAGACPVRPASEERRSAGPVDPLVDQVRDPAAIGDLLDDAALDSAPPSRAPAGGSGLEHEPQRLREAGARPVERRPDELAAGPGRRRGSARRLPRGQARSAPTSPASTSAIDRRQRPGPGRRSDTRSTARPAQGASPDEHPEQQPGRQPSPRTQAARPGTRQRRPHRKRGLVGRELRRPRPRRPEQHEATTLTKQKTARAAVAAERASAIAPAAPSATRPPKAGRCSAWRVSHSRRTRSAAAGRRSPSPRRGTLRRSRASGAADHRAGRARARQPPSRTHPRRERAAP